MNIGIVCVCVCACVCMCACFLVSEHVRVYMRLRGVSLRYVHIPTYVRYACMYANIYTIIHMVSKQDFPQSKLLSTLALKENKPLSSKRCHHTYTYP